MTTMTRKLKAVPTTNGADDWLAERYDEAISQWNYGSDSFEQFADGIFEVATEVLTKMGIDSDDPDEEQIGADAASKLVDDLRDAVDQLLWQYIQGMEVTPSGSKPIRVYDYLKAKYETKGLQNV